MKKLILIFSVLVGCTHNAETKPKERIQPKQNGRLVRIGVIDTGFDMVSTWPNANKTKFPLPKLCDTGHKDFTNTGLQDQEGHGTHITSLIAKGNADVNYCIVILKFWNPDTAKPLSAEITAINYAISLKVDIINMSIYGNQYVKAECVALKKALNAGIKVVAAAGNEHEDIVTNNAFPAMCDPRIVKVVNLNKNGKLNTSSNYSTVYMPNLYTIIGTDVYGLQLHNKVGPMTGTSQSAAIFTSNLIKTLSQDAK